MMIPDLWSMISDTALHNVGVLSFRIDLAHWETIDTDNEPDQAQETIGKNCAMLGPVQFAGTVKQELPDWIIQCTQLFKTWLPVLELEDTWLSSADWHTCQNILALISVSASWSSQPSPPTSNKIKPQCLSRGAGFWPCTGRFKMVSYMNLATETGWKWLVMICDCDIMDAALH